MKKEKIIRCRVTHKEKEIVNSIAAYEGYNLSETIRLMIREAALKRGIWVNKK